MRKREQSCLKNLKDKRANSKVKCEKKMQSKKYKRMLILFPSRRNSHKMVVGVKGGQLRKEC